MLGPILKGSLVTLAPIESEHLPNYCRWFADPEVTRFLAHAYPITLKDEEAWLERVARDEHEVMWGIFVEDAHLGSISVMQIDWRNRRGVTGIFIGDRSWWGRGVAGDAIRLRSRYPFEELGLEKLVTHVPDGNVAPPPPLDHPRSQTSAVHR